MKHSIRLISLLLAALFILSTLVSCADTTPSGENGGTESAAGAATDTAAVESETAASLDTLPDDLNFGGDQVVIISRDREGWTSGELADEGLNGDPINDAVYERNRLVEKRLNVKLKNILDKNHDYTVVVAEVARTVGAGLREYDIMAAPCNSALNESLNKTFLDLRGTEYMDLDAPYWSQGFNEALEYQGSQFAATGSGVLAMYRFAFVTIFNKRLFDDVRIPYLYEDVRNKTWTLDRQMELVPILYKSNGNGVQDLTGDIYGMAGSCNISVDPYWSSCRVDIIGKDENGEYTAVFDTAKLHNVVDKLMKLYYGSGEAVYNFPHEGQDDEQAKIRDLFAVGYAAMATVRVMELEAGTIRAMKDEFGVVPMPKYDAAQDGYRTLLHNQFTVFCIPRNVLPERVDEISAVLEALSSEGHRIVRPAYYETALRTKLVQDPESAEMLDIVVDNVYIDVGILYSGVFGSFYQQLRIIMQSGNNTVASDYKSRIFALERRTLPELQDKLEALIAASGS